jgi:hypothetical protein
MFSKKIKPKAMKKACISLILFLLVSSAFAQKRATRIIFNGGVQKAGMYEKIFQTFQCFEGCFPTSQTPALSFDINVLYQVQSKTPNLSFVYGIGLNQKSWNEEGLSSNGAGPIDNPYSFRNDLTYFGLFYGINYDFVVGNKTKLIAGSLINPEFLISNTNEVYNSLGASIRMTLGLEYQAFDNLAIQLTPYFQSAVMNYAKTPDFAGGPNSQTYTPYAFGLNLGIVLNRIAD